MLPKGRYEAWSYQCDIINKYNDESFGLKGPVHLVAWNVALVYYIFPQIIYSLS